MSMGIAIMKASFKRDRQYTLNHLINNVGSFFFGYIYAAIWMAASKSPAEADQMVEFVILNQASMWITLFLPYGCYLAMKVKEGTIRYEYLRPYGLLTGSFFEVAGHTLYNLFFRSIPLFLGGVLLFGVRIQRPDMLLPYLVAIFNAFLLSFLINYLMGLWCFKYIKMSGPQLFYYFCTSILGGYYIPFERYPEWMLPILKNLPFAAVGHLPTRVWFGQSSLLEVSLVQWSWIIVIFIIAWTLTKRLSGSFGVQGG